MKGVAKLNKKLGPIGMIAMSIAMPYAMQGLGGGVNWLMARPEGTLNAVGKMGNNIRLDGKDLNKVLLVLNLIQRI